MKKNFLLVAFSILVIFLIKCSSSKKTKNEIASASIDSTKGLKDYYKNYFPIGVSVGPQDLSGDEAKLILKEFNSLTPENAMKMGPIHPKENEYYWKDADSIVNFAQRHGLKVRGHNLCWYMQTPKWLFKDDNGSLVTKDVLLKRLKDHITTVMNRYKGKIYAWDVVNEAISDDSTNFLRNSLWYQICGADYIAKAFEYAHEADPDAILFYNDYQTDCPEKRDRVYKLLKQLVDAKVPINAVGMQGHWNLDEPTKKNLIETITKFSSLGLQVQITELDIPVGVVKKKDSTDKKINGDGYLVHMMQQQSEQYKKLFEVFRQYKKLITGVTFWNVSDRHSWLDKPGNKRFPLLLDEILKRKEAYWEIVDF